MGIEELRKEIDGIDEELVRLFVRRMGVSAQVAEYKKTSGRAVLDPSRERQLLERVSELAGEELESQTRVLYNLILSLSRSYQNHCLGFDGALLDKIRTGLAETNPVFPERAFVACQGVEGAYS